MPALPTLLKFLQPSIPPHKDITNTPPSPSEECAHMLPSLPDLLVPTGAHFNTDLSLILWTNPWL